MEHLPSGELYLLCNKSPEWHLDALLTPIIPRNAPFLFISSFGGSISDEVASARDTALESLEISWRSARLRYTSILRGSTWQEVSPLFTHRLPGRLSGCLDLYRVPDNTTAVGVL